MMKIYCTKHEFKNPIVNCNESTSCYNCVLKNICENNEADKCEALTNIVELIADPPRDETE